MLTLLALALLGGASQDWPAYNNGPENRHYSTLSQINPDNVSRLGVAWKYDTGDAFDTSEMQCNPLIVDGVLYATTPRLRVIALDAATGKLRWAFDPYQGQKPSTKIRNRGLNYWADGNDRRLYVAVRQYLYALDAATGKPVPSFGKDGKVDLRAGLGRDPETLTVSLSTPGVVYRDLLIIGGILPEDLPCPPGDIRAYDVRTGALRWSFHTLPHPGEFGYDTWPKDAWQKSGGANNWSGMALDEKRGMVYVPTGSAAFDFYGSDRIGDNLFANCLLALKADTGERVWHFQLVHHDVWDRDFPAPPTLVTVRHEGRLIDAVSQTTKSGWVLLFDRDTGKPLFPIEERAVPPSDVDGEQLATHQPFPLAPAPFVRQQFTEDLITGRTEKAHAFVLDRFRKIRTGPQFTPPSLVGSVIFPGLDGGGEWGGTAFDPETHLLYINANEMAWVLRLIPRPKPSASVKDLYLRECATCHRPDLRGTPPEFPNLLEVRKRLSRARIANVIRRGAGRMPAFASLPQASIEGLARYIKTGAEVKVPVPPPNTLKYGLDGYVRFVDSDGYPAVKPPWGTLNALNLDTGEYAWQIPFGEFPELAARGLRNTGSENYGGALITAGGLLFIGATNYDKRFRAFDKSNGKLLWETTLPAAGNATPSTYEVAGRQYVVIGAGGGKWGAPSGGTYVAFALPE